jgi:2-keto-4-pentenoate hydratase
MTATFDPGPAAAALRQMRAQRVVVTPLEDRIAPRTTQQGAAVQAAMARLDGAYPPFGFKIGATGARMQAYLGVDGPIAGFMEGRSVYLAHADLRFADYLRPGVECEVAVRLAADLPVGPCSFEQALDAVGDFVAGIELVENRYGDLTELGTPTLVADQMYHAAAVIGQAADWRGLDIGALHGRITLEGGMADDGSGDAGITSDLLGHPLNGLAWLAGSAEAAAFGGLKAGQVVMLGSVTPPVWLSGPATVTVTFDGLAPVVLRLG